MLTALYIFVDDDFDRPLYAEPDADDLEPDTWQRICQTVLDVQDDELDPEGTATIGDAVLGWRVYGRTGIAFVAWVEDVDPPEVSAYLTKLARHYFDEVDDARRPDRDGVADIVVDVIPPWED